MPAAAVIPAPLVYTNIAAVKTLVVCHWDAGLADGWLAGFARLAGYNLRQYVPAPKSRMLKGSCMKSPSVKAKAILQ